MCKLSTHVDHIGSPAHKKRLVILPDVQVRTKGVSCSLAEESVEPSMVIEKITTFDDVRGVSGIFLCYL